MCAALVCVAAFVQSARVSLVRPRASGRTRVPASEPRMPRRLGSRLAAARAATLPPSSPPLVEFSPSASAPNLDLASAEAQASSASRAPAPAAAPAAAPAPAPPMHSWSGLPPASSGGLHEGLSCKRRKDGLCVRRVERASESSRSSMPLPPHPSSRDPQCFSVTAEESISQVPLGSTSPTPSARVGSHYLPSPSRAASSPDDSQELSAITVGSEIAGHMSPIDLTELRALRIRFAAVDVNGRGVVNRDVFGKLFASIVGLPAAVSSHGQTGLLDFAYELFDASGSSTLHLRDFIAGCVVLGRGSDEERLRYLFQMYDRNRTGGLGIPELQRMFRVMRSYAVARRVVVTGTDIAPPEVAISELSAADARSFAIKAMRQHDHNSDGQLDFSEFCNWCASEPRAKDLIDTLCSDTSDGMDKLRGEHEHEMLLTELADMGFDDAGGYQHGYSLVQPSTTRVAREESSAITSNKRSPSTPSRPMARSTSDPLYCVATPNAPVDPSSEMRTSRPQSLADYDSQLLRRASGSGPISNSRSSRGTDEDTTDPADTDQDPSLHSNSTIRDAQDAQDESSYQVQRSASGRPGTFEIDFNSLRLIHQIGEGSFAKVWRGKWLDIDVAVKILKTGPHQGNIAATSESQFSSIAPSSSVLSPPQDRTSGACGFNNPGASFLDDSLEPEMDSRYGTESRSGLFPPERTAGTAGGTARGGNGGGNVKGDRNEGSGEGGGSVYQSQDGDIGATATVNRLRDRHHFLREIGLLTSLRHPNVLLLMGACTDPRYPLCIVSELVEGGSLHSHLHGRKSRRLSSTHAIRLALHVARGMLYMHSSTPIVLHRDLKSANILVEGIEDEDSSKGIIIDFGLSRLDSTVDSRAGGGGLCGTLATMAPEVMRSEMYQPASDVYSFGVILGEMFSGKLPFENSSAFQLIYSVGLQGKRPDFSEADGIPAPVMGLIQQCWAQEPGARPSFKSVVKSLNHIHRVLISEIGSSTSSNDHTSGIRR